MRSAWRTVDRRLLRDVTAISVAVGFVGISFGAIAVASGVAWWAVIAMSVFVFAAGSQFLALGLLAAGSPIAAVVAGLLLNARHLPFGLAVADVLSGSRGRRLVGAHLMVDESVAFALAQPDRPSRVRAYWWTGTLIFVFWQIGTVLGIRVGAVVGDPGQYGLDAAFPAGLVALLLPTLRDPAARRVAVLGALTALGVTLAPMVVPGLGMPGGVPVLLALLGLVLAGRAPSVIDASAMPGSAAPGSVAPGSVAPGSAAPAPVASAAESTAADTVPAAGGPAR